MTFFVLPQGQSAQNKTLAQYIVDVRRLLHDSTGNYWSDLELTDYINEARFRVVSDTGCNRILQTVNLVAGQEAYGFALLPQSTATIDVLNITVLWGSMRVPLNYMVFTEFNMKMRAWQSFQARPVSFTMYGQNTVYVGPIPDQTYVSEWDTVVIPNTLVNSGDVDSIGFPFTPGISFYAAYLAKYKEQSYEEADRLKAEYTKKIGESLRSSFTRRMPSVFGR
jgi:hypothetical protein